MNNVENIKQENISFSSDKRHLIAKMEDGIEMLNQKQAEERCLTINLLAKQIHEKEDPFLKKITERINSLVYSRLLNFDDIFYREDYLISILKKEEIIDDLVLRGEEKMFDKINEDKNIKGIIYCRKEWKSPTEKEIVTSSRLLVTKGDRANDREDYFRHLSGYYQSFESKSTGLVLVFVNEAIEALKPKLASGKNSRKW